METKQQNNNEVATIKNYRYLEKIGEGGYGLVFKAEQISTGQIVAIKTLKVQEGLTDQKKNQQLARFERETRLCAEINHPNIVQLIDKGYLGVGKPYAVFEYVQGETLKSYILRNKSLSAPNMAALMEQVLDALVCAHNKGIVHRDLKPQNIMVSKLGSKNHVKILDFGIGAFTHDFRSTDYRTLTMTQDVLGTPTYSAPEQLRGEPPTIKSDLYAWGLIVIECLTGKPVMDGLTIAEVFQKQLMTSNVPIPPSLIGHALAQLLKKVLEKNPINRAEDAQLIFKEFEQINFNTIIGDIEVQKSTIFYEDNKTAANNMVWSGTTSTQKQLTFLCLRLNLIAPDEVPLDLEILDTIQKDQLNLCKDTAIRYRGYVTGSLMNNLSICFGYPDSNDNDARRAGRTALELVSEIKKRSALLLEQHGVRIEIQIGLHTGTVLVHRNHTPDGNVPNTAFDLVYRANSGNVLVSSASKKLLDPYLEFEKSEVIHLSNEPGVMETYRLVGERQTEALSSLHPWSANREMIGRDCEKANILKMWDLTTEESKAVIVNGQAGIGKSKLTYEVKKEIQSIGGFIRECRCLPEHQNNALYPFFNMLRNHWGITETEDKDIVVSRLKFVLKEAGCMIDESLPLLCLWLSIPLPEGCAISQASPEKQKQMLFQTLKQCLLFMGNEKSFLLVVEDLHWLDPTSSEFIEYLLSDIEEQHFLLLMTSRPIFENPWKLNCLSQINLEILSNDSIELLVKGGLEGKSISEKSLAYISERADGIPLYVEELLSMLIEQNFLVLDNDIYNLSEDIDTKLIPMTLQDLLNARLDHLSLAIETAQLASAIGREFNYNLLIKASLKDEAEVQGDLDLLINTDLVYRQRKIQGENYIFRHALIRDAAYDGMVSSNRKEVHGRIANVLENDFPEYIKENPFELATHYSKATIFDTAVSYGVGAAKQSLDRSLNSETLEYSKQIINWIDAQNESSINQSDKLNIYCIQTYALMNKYGWGADNVKSSAERTFNLLKQFGEKHIDPSNIISSYWALITYYHVASERSIVKELTKQLLQLAKGLDDQTLVTSANVLTGIYCYTDGEFEACINSLELVMSQFDENNINNDNLTIGVDNFVYAAAMQSQVYWHSGKIMEARKQGDWAVERSRNIDHIPSLCLALLYRSAVHQFDNEKPEAKQLTDEILSLAHEYGLVAFSAYAATLNHWAVDDVSSIDQIVAQLEAMGCKLGLTYYMSLPAENEFAKGMYDQAIGRIDKCLNLCEENKEYYYQNKLRKMKESFIHNKKLI